MKFASTFSEIESTYKSSDDWNIRLGCCRLKLSPDIGYFMWLLPDNIPVFDDQFHTIMRLWRIYNEATFVWPVTTTKNFQFNVVPADQFDEESSKQISLKLKLTISRINFAQNAKEMLWDTLREL